MSVGKKKPALFATQLHRAGLGCHSTKAKQPMAQMLAESIRGSVLLYCRIETKSGRGFTARRDQPSEGLLQPSPQGSGSRRTRPTTCFVAPVGEWTPSGYQPVHGDRPRRVCLSSSPSSTGGIDPCPDAVGFPEISFNTTTCGRWQR